MSVAVDLASHIIEVDWEILHRVRRLQHRRLGVALARGQSRSVGEGPPDTLQHKAMRNAISLNSQVVNDMCVCVQSKPTWYVVPHCQKGRVPAHRPRPRRGIKEHNLRFILTDCVTLIRVEHA